jgi:lipoprotein signal peptidase
MVALTVFYFSADKRRAWLRNALVFIIAGGVGNLIDRVYYQIWIPSAYGVRDMVDLSAFGFGVCNFADFFIVGGAIPLVFALLFCDTEALKPLGKYKALAQESQEKEERKKAEKAAKKAAKKGGQ